MPVEFLPDDDVYEPAPAVERADRSGETFSEVLVPSLRAAALCLIVGCVVAPLMVIALRAAVNSAQYLMTKGEGEFWQNAFMPAVLYGIVGGLFGVATGWRITNATGATGLSAFAAGGAACVALTAYTVAWSAFVFGAAIPTMQWVCLAVMLGLGLIALRVYLAWEG
jgi:hypothetical protein